MNASTGQSDRLPALATTQHVSGPIEYVYPTAFRQTAGRR